MADKVGLKPADKVRRNAKDFRKSDELRVIKYNKQVQDKVPLSRRTTLPIDVLAKPAQTHPGQKPSAEVVARDMAQMEGAQQFIRLRNAALNDAVKRVSDNDGMRGGKSRGRKSRGRKSRGRKSRGRKSRGRKTRGRR